MTIRKRAVSIRMNKYDIDGVKKLARRLGVRDSDVIRSAIKMMMTKLGSLTDVNVKGRSLVPVFVESGPDLLRHFDIDALRLEQIINDGVAHELQVDCDDIRLLAMNVGERPPMRLGVGGSAMRAVSTSATVRARERTVGIYGNTSTTNMCIGPVRTSEMTNHGTELW